MEHRLALPCGGDAVDAEDSSPRRDALNPARRRLRICHFVRQYAPGIGGLETYVAELARQQMPANDVYVVTLDRLFGQKTKLRRVERQDGVVIVRIPFIGARECFLPLLTARLLSRFDILHVHACDQLLDVVASLQYLHRRPIFETTHGLFFHTPRLKQIKKAYFRTITCRSLRRCAAVFAVSRSDADQVSRIGVSTQVLPNPVKPLGDFIASGKDLVYLGRIAPNKQIGKLLQFMAFLGQLDPMIRLHIVGADSDKRWAKLKSPSSVIFHGYLEPAQLRDVLRRCRFVVSASAYEGYGLSIVECMSVGLLPILNDNTAFREIQERSGVGLITNFDLPSAACAAFLKYREGIGLDQPRRAIAFALDQSWATTSSKILEYYHDAAA